VTDDEAFAIVEAARLTPRLPVRLPEMISFLDDEIAHRLSSARAWTKLGHDVTGEEWARKLRVAEAILTLLQRIMANPEAQSTLAAALRSRKNGSGLDERSNHRADQATS
jgi:hypothetical protein